MPNYCPNCGTELQKSIQGFTTSEETVEIKAKGGVLICPGCNMASTPQESAEHPATESPPGEANVRGEEGPERPEDSIVPEGEGFSPAPTTSPEVALEEELPPEEIVAVAAEEEGSKPE